MFRDIHTTIYQIKIEHIRLGVVLVLWIWSLWVHRFVFVPPCVRECVFALMRACMCVYCWMEQPLFIFFKASHGCTSRRWQYEGAVDSTVITSMSWRAICHPGRWVNTVRSTPSGKTIPLITFCHVLQSRYPSQCVACLIREAQDCVVEWQPYISICKWVPGWHAFVALF